MLPVIAATGVAVGAGLAGWSALVARRMEALVPPEGRMIEVPGARLHVVEMGEGPPLVMIHGLMGQLRNYSHSLAQGLARDHRLILVDRPGWGHSELLGPRPGIVEQAEMMAALIRKLGLIKPLVVGHSMGGAVALAMAQAHPELIRGLALIAPFANPEQPIPPMFAGLLAPAPVAPLVAWFMAVPVGSWAGPASAAAVFAPDPVPEDFGTQGGGALALRPKSYLAGSFEVRHASADMARIAERFGEMSVPVAILYGRGDQVLIPSLNGEATAAAIPHASLELIDGGHMLPVTHAAEVEAWLRRVIASC